MGTPPSAAPTTAATAPGLASDGGRPPAHPFITAHDGTVRPCSCPGHVPVRCCVCRRVKGAPELFRLGRSAKASDGICPKCWGPYRESLGLPKRPYAGGSW